MTEKLVLGLKVKWIIDIATHLILNHFWILDNSINFAVDKTLLNEWNF